MLTILVVVVVGTDDEGRDGSSREQNTRGWNGVNVTTEQTWPSQTSSSTLETGSRGLEEIEEGHFYKRA